MAAFELWFFSPSIWIKQQTPTNSVWRAVSAPPENLHKGKYSLKYMTAKDRLLTSKCVECNKIYEKKFDENLSKIVESTHQFCDGNINKFGVMLQKTVYSREYVSGWKRLYETPLPTKKEFCSNLTMENIIDTDYKNAKRI